MQITPLHKVRSHNSPIQTERKNELLNNQITSSLVSDSASKIVKKNTFLFIFSTSFLSIFL